jgi:prepilin-type processing-associated H-X9-DG protein
MDNHRRLAAGWLAFASDNDGRLVANLHGGILQAGAISSNWTLGWLDWTTATVNTNSAHVADPRYSALATYVNRDPSLFKCPADEYVSPAQAARGWTGRIRSYSMNGNMGPGNSKDLFGMGYAVYEKLSDFRKLPPSQAFVLMEEHPDSINDPCFFVNLTQATWIDLPAAFHDRAAWFGFADGHVELRRWQSARTIVPVKVGPFPVMSPLPPSDPDYNWLKTRASERY